MRTRHGRRGAFLVAWGLLWAVGGASTAADSAVLDKQLYDALKEMHNRAADLYNGGDSNGCYRMFQGGLILAKPLLAHRPEVQQLIDQGLQNAERQASIPQRAKLLHETIEAARNRLKPATAVKTTSTLPMDPKPMNPMPMPPESGNVAAPVLLPPPGGASKAPAKTLWERLGGEEKVTKVVDDFLDLTLDDKSVNLTRNGAVKFDKAKAEELKVKLVGYVSSLSEGTVVPASTRGLADIHGGQGVPEAEFKAFVESLRFALEKNGVPRADAEELLRKVRAASKDVVTAPGGDGKP